MSMCIKGRRVVKSLATKEKIIKNWCNVRYVQFSDFSWFLDTQSLLSKIKIESIDIAVTSSGEASSKPASSLINDFRNSL